MADAASCGATGVEPGRQPTSSSPRWVKVFGTVVVVLVLLLIAVAVFGGGPGGHGPGRHTLSSGGGEGSGLASPVVSERALVAGARAGVE